MFFDITRCVLRLMEQKMLDCFQFFFRIYSQRIYSLQQTILNSFDLEFSLKSREILESNLSKKILLFPFFKDTKTIDFVSWVV